jgi:YidC/Oxa1 family membrane protein insertase
MIFSLILGSPLTPLEDVLRSVLEWLNGTVGLPWAWSIVALTVIVRLLMVPLAVKQIHSMQAMQAHMPEMKSIQQRYKNDKQKRNEELMKFYRDNNVNPAAPCLPLLFQFPVFIALYLVLRKFSKHPPGGNLSWLHGLVPNITDHANAHWSGYLLLTIYVGSQLASTYFMSTTMEKTQRTMMMVLPIVFVPVLVNFPTGLVIYWVTTNLWTVGQGLVTRQLVPKKPPAPPKRTSRTPPKADAAASDGAKQDESSAPEQPVPEPAAPRRVKRKKKKRARR